jgi:hypothetical protein
MEKAYIIHRSFRFFYRPTKRDLDQLTSVGKVLGEDDQIHEAFIYDESFVIIEKLNDMVIHLHLVCIL